MILRVGTVYDTEAFRTLYSYDGSDLGVRYSRESTRFCVWAPTASAANILLYENGVPLVGETYETVQMARSTKGTWTAVVPRDIKGAYYTYQVFVNSEWREAIDPYTKAVGANGLRGQIIDLRETNPEGWERDCQVTPDSPVDAVIYELHIRDLSSQDESGITNKGKFLGLAERETMSPGGLKTGLDHILELGVTHVHLLPVFDFSSVDETGEGYNWGYDPQNYNAPEGSYSTDPFNGAVRIRELKQAIKVLHSNGLGVIIDVVYNHVSNAAESCFERLVPGYFFRTEPEGELSNGSGCGNEMASERHMVRKYIADSVSYWAREYHLDGFRFDLMGLHDIETMTLIRDRLDEIDPSILIYGEGWTCGDSPLPEDERATIANAFKLSGIAVFNDTLRDGVKGNVFDNESAGFVSGDFSRAGDVKLGMSGMDCPSRYVNYCSSHDNHTLWDKLSLTSGDNKKLEAMNRLAAAITLTSQGIPFFQAGEEMARTKYGDCNSYRSPDSVNQLDWNRKSDFLELFKYYKGLITLRKAMPQFRLRTSAEVASRMSFIDTGFSSVIAYILDKSIIAVFNADSIEREIKLPHGEWNILVNGERAGLTPMGRVVGKLTAAPVSVYVLKRAAPRSIVTGNWLRVAGKLVMAGIAVGLAAGIGRYLFRGKRKKKMKISFRYKR